MNLLQKARKKYELTGYQVAAAAKMDRSYYRRIEIGTYIPSPLIAQQISDAFEELTGIKVVTPSDVVFMNAKKRAKEKAAKTSVKTPKKSIAA